MFIQGRIVLAVHGQCRMHGKSNVIAAEIAGMLCPCVCNNRLCVTVAEPVHIVSVAGCLHFKRDRAASLRLVIVAQILEAGFGL